MIRQPIVSVLGHVDHGKTALLDSIRGSNVAAREPGAITQHIGATEVPSDTITDVCGDLMEGRELEVPGLLFIDTPGHHSFVTLRARGGALADLAVLVIDINEGIMPQTVESLSILKRFKTPFLVAANKIDRVAGWRKKTSVSFREMISDQPESYVEYFDQKFYELVGQLYQQGFDSEMFDKIEDFTTVVAVVPTSGKFAVGIQEVLLMLVGLAQRFLTPRLKTVSGPAKGTILEVKEERGLGPTIDTIIYDGVIRKGDTIVLGGTEEPLVTRARTLLKPKPLDEIRDPRERFDSVDEVYAAAGIKISGSGLESAIAGSPLRVSGEDVEEAKKEVIQETKIEVETEDTGILVKADAIGSLEAISFELRNAKIPVKMAEVGDVSKRDVVSAATVADPLKRVIFAFNVDVLPDAKEELVRTDVKLLEGNIIYGILEDYQAWAEEMQLELERRRLRTITHPGKILLLEDHIFRASKPAIVGVRVLAGRIRQGVGLLRDDGRVIGKIKSLRSGEDSLKEAIAGSEVAMAVDGVTVGRQMSPGDVLYVDIPESAAKKLDSVDLNPDEKEVLERVKEIKREEDPFWGM
ncbi:MAG: translation initiation factor IF-2 [Thermoplasmata archaeon]|nr:translation initiation factor IF-2 [Thermoplasmata archaeon]